jgi:hypothetical protein
MKVNILKVATNQLVEASINKGIAKNLPSIHDNWRFNFNKHALLPNSTAYVLVSEETSDIIEGCMIFQMRKKVEPYMAYLEVAPHNRETPKKYLYVAGCLIAFAYKQTFVQASGDYMGYLTFDVQENNPKNEKKLISLYNKQYNAKIVAGTNSTMVIADKDGDSLIEEYLNHPQLHITNPKLN